MANTNTNGSSLNSKPWMTIHWIDNSKPWMTIHWIDKSKPWIVIHRIDEKTDVKKPGKTHAQC